LSLAVVVLYAIVVGHALLSADESKPLTSQEWARWTLGAGCWFVICLVFIWWGDELGEGIVGAKFGMISSTSPGWAVKLLGWVLLLLPAVIVWLSGRTGE
jgi:hypothetical protein